MISSDIRINGALIAHVYATNTSGVNDGGLAGYSWVYQDIETGKRTAGRVEHERSRGAAALIAAILQDYGTKS